MFGLNIFDVSNFDLQVCWWRGEQDSFHRQRSPSLVEGGSLYPNFGLKSLDFIGFELTMYTIMQRSACDLCSNWRGSDNCLQARACPFIC